MKLKNLLTIVIPTKNERDIINTTLTFLNSQKDIKGVKVIICDNSYDDTRSVIKNNEYDNIKIKITDGGFPSVARNIGANICKTPYILFLDADMFLLDENIISENISTISENGYHLLTTKIRTSGKYKFVYPMFEFFRKIMSKKIPFALGGFMMFNKEEFDNIGKFNEEDLFAEDFHISMKINPKKFFISKHKVYTSERRFENKGLFYMFKMAILSYINKNKPEFFKNDHSYWI